MSNLELLQKMFPNKFLLTPKEVLPYLGKGYSYPNWFAEGKKNNQCHDKWPPFYDANGGQKTLAKWEIQLVDLAQWLDNRKTSIGN